MQGYGRGEASMRGFPAVLTVFLLAWSVLTISAHFPGSPPAPRPILSSDGISYPCLPADEMLVSNGVPLKKLPTADPASALEMLHVHFINVGKGDAILIDQGETEILIDGGRELPGIVDYLCHYVDGPLDVMIATHPHDDHIGGLIEVLAEFDVGEIWHNGEEIDRRLSGKFKKALEAERADTFVARLGDTIELGELVFRVVNPANLDGSTNDNSIVLIFSYGSMDFLFTADIEKPAEYRMIDQTLFPIGQVEILKVAHHGLTASSSPEFLQMVRPVVAIVMANHPENRPTLETLNGMGVDVYMTSENGTIVVDTDGNKFTVRCEL